MMEKLEINNYRFTSLEELTDDMLEQLMSAVAEKSKIESKLADEKYFQQKKEDLVVLKQKWETRLKMIKNE